jgi:ATP-dependent DNA helicase RecG
MDLPELVRLGENNRQSAAVVYADEVMVERTSVNDLDLEHLKEFFRKQFEESLEGALQRDRIPLEQFLKNLGLIGDTQLNLAALLLFGRAPQQHRPALVVKAVSLAGNDPSETVYRESEDISGSLRDLFKGIRSFLIRNLRKVQGDKGFNSLGDLEVSATALGEVLVNMLLHRDYFISAPWRIFIFDNRIELISPGALPNTLSIANIRHGVSIIRTPLLASYGTRELPYRGLGTGIRRAMAAQPNIEFENDPDRQLFIARIPRPIA